MSSGKLVTLLVSTMTWITSSHMGMVRILVGIKLLDCLAYEITITYIYLSFSQSLDYKGIPFKCDHFHLYGNIAKECTKGVHRSHWAKKNSGEGFTQKNHRKSEQLHVAPHDSNTATTPPDIQISSYRGIPSSSQ
jgi:hypothetical protein